jgi:stage II sporulation protein D
VNDVDVDSYLMSVVSKELLSRWQLEAYKAQAIAARTYALYEARTGPSGRAYDLQDDERSQMYGGIGAETNISRQSVMETAGVVLAYGPEGQEKIFKTYFSSCCGGIGQSAYDAFGDADIPPLRAKNAGTLCNASPKYNWGPIVLSKSEVTRRVRNWASSRNRPEKNIDLVTRIDIAPGAQVTGRPSRFLLTDSRGNQYSLSAEETRSACNDPGDKTNRLTSSFFKPVNGPDTIQFVEGHGNGHGVGMCQWCAEAMAERGQKAEYIVRVSYPGAVLVRAY